MSRSESIDPLLAEQIARVSRHDTGSAELD